MSANARCSTSDSVGRGLATIAICRGIHQDQQSLGSRDPSLAFVAILRTHIDGRLLGYPPIIEDRLELSRIVLREEYVVVHQREAASRCANAPCDRRQRARIAPHRGHGARHGRPEQAGGECTAVAIEYDSVRVDALAVVEQDTRAPAAAHQQFTHMLPVP